MKTQSPHVWLLAAIIAGLPWVGGCNQASSRPTSPITNATSAVNPEAASKPPALVEVSEVLPAKPQPADTSERPLPAGVKPSPNLTEVLKLAQAGVEDRVVLTFITNSPGTFNLGSDSIIYLNDIGVSSDLITAMIEHDLALGRAVEQNALAAAAATPPAANTDPEPEPAASGPISTADQTQAAQPTTVNNFYSDLAPYGNWVNVSGYGNCWQPSVAVVNSGWRPYCNGGRWIYSDCGWYWYSDYTWGSTAFHYGRWFAHPSYGWCWYPGTVWAPSWVTWSYSPGYCGWAPLPPAACYTAGLGFSYYGASVGISFGFGLGTSCFNYVQANQICHPRPWTCTLPPVKATSIHNNSIRINNFADGQGNTVVNHGISRNRFKDASGAPLQPVPVRDTVNARGPGRGVRDERIERNGDQMVLYRPQPLSRAPATPSTTAVAGPQLLSQDATSRSVRARDNHSRGTTTLSPANASGNLAAANPVTVPASRPIPRGNGVGLGSQSEKRAETLADRINNVVRTHQRESAVRPGNNTAPAGGLTSVTGPTQQPATVATRYNRPPVSAENTQGRPSPANAPLVISGRRPETARPATANLTAPSAAQANGSTATPTSAARSGGRSAPAGTTRYAENSARPATPSSAPIRITSGVSSTPAASGTRPYSSPTPSVSRGNPSQNNPVIMSRAPQSGGGNAPVIRSSPAPAPAAAVVRSAPAPQSTAPAQSSSRGNSGSSSGRGNGRDR